jgi:hypothetical protein
MRLRATLGLMMVEQEDCKSTGFRSTPKRRRPAAVARGTRALPGRRPPAGVARETRALPERRPDGGARRPPSALLVEGVAALGHGVLD